MKKRINILTKIIFSLSLLFVFANASDSNKGFIIVGSNIQENNLSKKEIKNIFMGKTTLWKNGERIDAGIYTKNKEKINYFFDNFLNTSSRRYKQYWLKQIFSGNGIAPKIFKDLEDAIEYSKNNKNSVLFIAVENEEKLKGIKIITINGKQSF